MHLKLRRGTIGDVLGYTAVFAAMVAVRDVVEELGGGCWARN